MRHCVIWGRWSEISARWVGITVGAIGVTVRKTSLPEEDKQALQEATARGRDGRSAVRIKGHGRFL